MADQEGSSGQRGRMGKFVLVVLAGCVGFLLLFAALSEEVFEGDAARFDRKVRTTVHHLAVPDLTSAMRAITFMGSPQFLGSLFLIIIGVFLLLKWRRAVKWFAVAMAGAVTLTLTLKLSFHRPRPSPFFAVNPKSFSYPSGHALGSFCFYLVLAGLITYRLRNAGAKTAIWVFAALLVLAIGLSRIYLGVHYPTDVVAGYLAGGGWVTAMIAVDRLRGRR